MGIDVWNEFDLILRLLAGTAAGVIVGWERTIKQSMAGIRTFGLVGLGTATAAAVFAGPDQVDAASRVIQGVLTGIGFLGAGVISLAKEERTPRGLTTAAAVWVTAALGCAAGLGDWPIVLTGTAVAILLLAVNHSVERWAGRPRDRTDKVESGSGSATSLDP